MRGERLWLGTDVEVKKVNLRNATKEWKRETLRVNRDCYIRHNRETNAVCWHSFGRRLVLPT